MQKASGFGHEYSNVPLTYHFLCSVVTPGVGEAGIAASEALYRSDLSHLNSKSVPGFI